MLTSSEFFIWIHPRGGVHSSLFATMVTVTAGAIYELRVSGFIHRLPTAQQRLLAWWCRELGGGWWSGRGGGWGLNSSPAVCSVHSGGGCGGKAGEMTQVREWDVGRGEFLVRLLSGLVWCGCSRNRTEEDGTSLESSELTASPLSKLHFGRNSCLNLSLCFLFVRLPTTLLFLLFDERSSCPDLTDSVTLPQTHTHEHTHTQLQTLLG